MSFYAPLSEPVARLDLLNGQPNLVAAHSARRISYYAAADGQPHGARPLQAPSDYHGEAWQTFLLSLRAPNHATLPIVQIPHAQIHTSEDGLQCLYLLDDSLILESDQHAAALLSPSQVRAQPLRALAFDRMLGFCAAVDVRGVVQTFQQNAPMSQFELGLQMESAVCSVHVTAGGGALWAGDGTQVVVCDLNGGVRKRWPMHYPIAQIAYGSSGKLFATADVEGVLRLYDGAGNLRHQRHSADLLRELGCAVGTVSRISALAVSNGGRVAFVADPWLCCVDTEQMQPLPRQPRLL
jgi:hypothetical protein